MSHDPIFFTPPSGKTSGPRRLYKGGKGGSDDPAEYQKQVDSSKEAARQAYYSGTNYADPSQREANYRAMEKDIVGYHRDKLDRERGTSQRQLGFNMARSGMSGSSVDAQDRAELQRKYLEGLSDISSKAAGASADARSGYEGAFNKGLQQINSGADAQTQIAGAMNEYSNTLQQALEGAKGASWGNFFGDIASTTDTAKVNAQQALVASQVNQNPAQSKLTQTGSSTSGAGGVRSYSPY